MGKFHVTIRTKFGEIHVEGDSREELLDLVKEAMAFVDDIETLIPEEKVAPSIPPLAPAPTVRKELEGVIEVTADGHPQILVRPETLTAREVIGLLLYWKHPEGLLIGELTNLVSLNWKAVGQPYVAANVGQMKGLLLREGPRGRYVFKLSGSGKSWVENDLLPKLRGEKK